MSFLSRLFGRNVRAHPPAVASAPTAARQWNAHDNVGTRYHDVAHASSAWATMHLTTYTPVVIFYYPTLEAARHAMLQLPFIHEAADTGELIATEIIEFGCYLNEAGQGEAILCGKGLTLNVWQEAKDRLAAAGGVLHREQKPESQPAPPKVAPALVSATAVKFVREDHKGMHTYRVHTAPNKAAAMAFLQDNSVTRNYVYLIVETPEGIFGRDVNGIYEE